jgi:xanthosine utilization system XapX-like protein
MLERVAKGIAAGAAGTTALDVVTYTDMAIRGRPPSEVPTKAVEGLAARVGLDLGAGERAQQRKSGIGALLGYATGLSVGAVYGLTARMTDRLPAPLASAVVGLGTMAATDGVSAALGATDPKTWTAADWVSDVVPHLIFGWATVATFRAMRP